MTVNVKLFEKLDDVARDSGELLSRANQPSIYDRLAWFQMTAKHCGRSNRPLVARATGDHSSAWLFLCRNGANKAEALASWYTLDFDLVRHGEEDALVPALARGLGDLAHIRLGPLADPMPIAQGFREAGWRATITPRSVNWYVDPPADFEAFWNARPSKLRSTAKRKAKKAGLDIRIHRGFDEAAWVDYRRVYEQSWKPEEGSWDFMRDFVENEGRAGALRLGIAYSDDEPVAAQLWHVENGRATIHKLAYAESAKQLSPGTILSEAMFRHVIEEDRPARIDYGTGDEGYKADWMETARPLYTLDLYNMRHPGSWPLLARRWLSGLVRRGASD